jgi:hypothetical protein
MKTNWKEIDKMSRMSGEQFQKYDTGLRDKEQAAKQRETTRAAEQWLSGAKGETVPNTNTNTKIPEMLSVEEWTKQELNKKGVARDSEYREYVSQFKQQTGTETPQEAATRTAQRMMQEDQFRMKAAQQGLNPATIEYVLKNKVPFSFRM